MRLLATTILALAVPALAQPAAAREHYRHHVWRHASHHQLARLRASYRRVRASADMREGHGDLDAMIARHAAAEGVPEALVHRVVIRESRYHPRVIGVGGAMGLMQIKYATARAMGYTGSPAGLLDPDTNLTYAVRYLAGAYRVANGNADRAVMNYARGYYGSAKRAGFSPYQRNPWSGSYASARSTERLAQNRDAAWRMPSETFDRQLAAR